MAEEDSSVVVFHSGTRRQGKTIVTDGGRVLGVTAVADDLSSALISAYEAVNKIHFEGMHYRRDIGAKGISRRRVRGRSDVTPTCAVIISRESEREQTKGGHRAGQ